MAMMNKKSIAWMAVAGLSILILVAALSLGPLLVHAAPAQQTTSAQSPPAPKAIASDTPPSIPVEQIIQKFAAKEAEFREALGNYTYTQSYLVQDWGPEGERGGEYRMDSDIIFTPDGKRIEKITYAPQSTLVNLSITQEDLKDLQGIQPFVLTSEDLPKYNIDYERREHVDELNTYVFKVEPKRIEKNQRYFQGTIWVDDEDLQIVKTLGKAVPDIHKGQENLFPTFETYREQIDGKFWFPTYTRADDTLHFKGGGVRIHMVVRYTNYKQFKSTIKIIPIGPPDKQPPKKPQP